MNPNTPTDLQAALRELESWQSEPPAAGQRRFTRFPARGEAILRPGGAADSARTPIAHIRDVSRGGVGILTTQPAEPGRFWQLQLRTGKTTIATIPGFCRFCRQVLPGAYLIGIAFGIDAGVLLSLGVSATDLAERDVREEAQGVKGEFIDPATFMEDNAA